MTPILTSAPQNVEPWIPPGTAWQPRWSFPNSSHRKWRWNARNLQQEHPTNWPGVKWSRAHWLVRCGGILRALLPAHLYGVSLTLYSSSRRMHGARIMSLLVIICIMHRFSESTYSSGILRKVTNGKMFCRKGLPAPKLLSLSWLLV